MLSMLSLCFLVANLLAPSVVHSMPTSQSAAATTTPSSLEANKIDEASSEHDDIDERHLSRSMDQPRQLFKLSLLDSTAKSRPDLSAGSSQKRLAFKQAMRRTISVRQHSPAGSGLNGTEDKLRGPMKQLSSAALKKLLNQALMSGSMGSKSNSSSQPAAASDLKSSNFKFVFIQKAAAAGNNSVPAEKQPAATSSYRGKQSTAKPASSLAASVSKQLATSLLYSAANLVGNFTGPNASLSSLASQLVSLDGVQQAAPNKQAHTQPTEAKFPPSSASQPTENSLPSSSDIARLGSKTKAKSKQQGENSAKKVKKNSKIYNLPVKFVSNGQPSQILVLNTLKQHFAAIKRLQTAASNLSSLAGVSAGIRHKSNPTKTSSTSGAKKTKTPNDKNSLSSIKIKGVNSRLIYLPLKFLSNGHPSRLTLTRTPTKSKYSS